MVPKRVAIRVREIHCASCEEAIERALRRQEGVIEVHAQSEGNTVEVVFDPDSISDRAIRDLLASRGFPPVG